MSGHSSKHGRYESWRSTLWQQQGCSALVSQDPARKERVRMVAIQLQYTAGQLSVGHTVGHMVMRLYSIHNYRRYFIEEERRLKGGVACALGVASPPNKFDNGGRA